MTREEAIKILEQRFDSSCRNNLFQNAEKLDYEDALWMAISALRSVNREQVDKLWKGKWIIGEPEGLGVPIHADQKKCMEYQGHIFCGRCGAPMSDEAVQMVMEKMEALHGET